MKKIVFLCLFTVVCSHLTLADKKVVTVTVEGDKNGSTTVNPNGTVSIDCDVSYNTCARVRFEIDERASTPSIGDYTVMEVFDADVLCIFSGGFVSEMIEYEHSDMFVYSLTLSALQEE